MSPPLTFGRRSRVVLFLSPEAAGEREKAKSVLYVYVDEFGRGRPLSTDQRPVRVGIDIGGTFTDLQILDARLGTTVAHKVPTTPEDPSIGLIAGLKEAGARYNFALHDVGYLLHGTTIATNAVLERKFPAGALVTTAGFEDILEIGRHSRRDIYTVKPVPVPALIERRRRLGVAERITGRGAIETAITEAALDDLVRRIAALQVETVAVCLLNAYVNSAHEEIVAKRLARDLPGLTVSLSAQVSPELREYERTSTTVLNALLMPVVQVYLARLEKRMAAEGLDCRLLIVQSNGGVCSAETAGAEPVRLLLSGPSGGALGALTLAKSLDEPDLVGVDMGGTSFDVCVVSGNRIEVVAQGEIDRLPVRVPMIEIRTIGAGGGSIARVDATGRASVGPQSAGAHPGPVCYARGGTEPTVTDANLLLGRLDPAFFLGGRMPLDLDVAGQALQAKFARPLGLGLEAAAEGLLALTNTNLAAAIRVSLFEKGLDPRDFAMASFGGAGSIHACAVADELGITRVIFPLNASTFSAWGILHSDIGHDFARSRVMPFDADVVSHARDVMAALHAEADARLASDGIASADRIFKFAADLRYRGQAFELTVPWDTGATVETVASAFHAMHQQRFSYSNSNDAVELVTLRLTGIGRLARNMSSSAEATTSTTSTISHRRVWLSERWHDVPVWRRDAIGPGLTIDGPAIIEEEYTTSLVGIGWMAVLGASGAIVARKAGVA